MNRATARAQGLHIYTTGRSCAKAHAPLQRYTKSGSCVACTLEHSQRQHADPATRQKRLAQQRARYAASPILRSRLALQHKEWARNNPEARVRHWRNALGLPEATRPEPEVCEGCGRLSKYSLHLDHDHATGKFRGWLCRVCNASLGALGDDLPSIMRIVAYLERAQ